MTTRALTSERLNLKLIDFECRLKSHRKLIINLHQPTNTIHDHMPAVGLCKQTTGQPEMTHDRMNDAAKELAGGIGRRNSGVNSDNILVERNLRSLSSGMSHPTGIRCCALQVDKCFQISSENRDRRHADVI
ncbi:hypothetical protein CVT25_000855 [Psilocybe cyanescens]|uniref:Uncharacterized protein n=1 Tax=Psilocybe cyanescens TaxID=93625 RepID=A0A409XUG6_PSICY|nr:hypothetical protein CVT25_000855 [Psilocybe cyanescens]